jgi:excisionase family DNA binding protein
MHTETVKTASEKEKRPRQRRNYRLPQKLSGVDHDALVTSKELAQALGCCSRTIANLIKQGSIPRVRVGTLNRFVVSDVIEALSEQPETA